MWYAKDKLDEKKQKRDLYRQAVERRLMADSKTKVPKKYENDADLLKRRKGDFGGTS